MDNHLGKQKEIKKQKKSQEERKNSRGAPSLEEDSEEAKDMLNQEKRDAVAFVQLSSNGLYTTFCICNQWLE